MNAGRVVSSGGLDLAAREFDNVFEEEHVPHSTALHSRIRGRGAYLTGPLSRYNLNFDKFPASVQSAARDVGFAEKCLNPFESITIRAIEIMYAFEEAIRVIESYEPPETPAAPVELRAGVGYACTEAPRGTLYHRYSLDEKGIILNARIVPPTSQNQKMIESDLREYVAKHIDTPTHELRGQCEQVIRNYDPCISCSTHFLQLEVEREP
jgi:coenzyme F420-reducing hydrogenase alpha subunit